MPATTSAAYEFAEMLPTEDATRRLASDLAALLQPGDIVTLSGDLGAGKTTLARGLIRTLAGNDTLEVPSPTFTLVQTYDLPRFPIIHADLYRIADPQELAELGIEEAETAAILIEWPDRAGDALPADRIDVALTVSAGLGLNHRDVRVTGHGRAAATVERLHAVRRFLDLAGFADADRQHLQGDASTRAYQRLTLRGRSVIFMNSPKRPDGPAVHHGVPYSAIAHLAEDVKPFVAMARGLRERGFSAPEIYAVDLENGLIVLEDFGTDLVVSGDPPAPIAERYTAAVDVLVALHGQNLPEMLPVAPGIDHRIPAYDIDALMIEAELLTDWYLPLHGLELSADDREHFVALWRAALDSTLDAPMTWLLRDFHSPNLLWLPQREGIARVGLLDFQDAVLGPPAYDLVSLLHDARVDVPESLEIALLSHYAKARRQADTGFAPAAFVELYALLGAQRATKILGIFARLHMRDGKSQYLRHMPRVWNYLTRALSHGALAPLKAWYDDHVPPPQSP